MGTKLKKEFKEIAKLELVEVIDGNKEVITVPDEYLESVWKWVNHALKESYKEGYNDGIGNGWVLANNNIKDVIKPWCKGVHNMKLPKYDLT